MRKHYESKNHQKGISWSNRYKRFFLDENTALIAASASILILPVNYYFGTHSGGIDPAGLYDLLMRLVLVGTLFYSLKTHKLFLMQAATFITFCNNIEFYCKLKHFSNSSTLVLIVLWLLLRLNSDTIV